MSNQAELTVIVGLGKTGLACARYLAKRGSALAITDSRDNPPGLAELQVEMPDVLMALGRLDEDLISRASELVVSPGVAVSNPAIAKAMAKGAVAIGDIELFARDANAPIIAITGTNGKSTVTTLVGEMARHAGKNVQVGGNLGTPALELILNPAPDLYVLELSSFQLETTHSLKSTAAVVLNISPDHMDRYDTLADYLKAKQRIYQNCKKAIVNRDAQETRQGLINGGNQISYGLGKPQDAEFGLLEDGKELCLAFGNKYLMPIKDLKIKGRHQVSNALAALALGYAIDLPMEAMIKAMREFPGLVHRCQWLTKKDNVDWYNDSKGTNVGATQAAIEGLGPELDGKLILIAGGQGKDADFSTLQKPVAQFVRTTILIGEDADKIAHALSGSCEIKSASTMEEAVKIANGEAQKGDAVLLSPACASFDMFDNFEHRGDVFISAVQDLT